MKKLEHPWDLFIKQKVLYSGKRVFGLLFIMLRKKRVILQYAISSTGTFIFQTMGLEHQSVIK